MNAYQKYSDGSGSPGDIVIRFFHSGGQVRGYIRKIAEPGEDDAILPGEEMNPVAAFRMAENKINGEPGKHIFVELSDDVKWDPSWGSLG